MKHPSSSIHRAALALIAAAGIALAPLAEAAGNRGGGHGGGHAAGGGRGKPEINHSRTDARANNVRSTSVNNVNVNKNVNVNVDNNRGCCHNGWDNDYHPVATAAAVTATVAVTSAIIGSIVNSPPPGCVPVNYGGYIYQQCGSTWYQPQGTQYVVIAPPY
ncbi:MAG: hypothetical protein MUF08_16040 [Burkholderiaceae bacterium]|jgi:hypothetical protein|nr:hypothetical protein [Burkholderiaceae bacterium]